MDRLICKHQTRSIPVSAENWIVYFRANNNSILILVGKTCFVLREQKLSAYFRHKANEIVDEQNNGGKAQK